MTIWMIFFTYYKQRVIVIDLKYAELSSQNNNIDDAENVNEN